MKVIGVCAAGQKFTISTENFGLYTKCSDLPNSINCAAKLMDAKKWFQVPNGTIAQVFEVRDNPLRPSKRVV